MKNNLLPIIFFFFFIGKSQTHRFVYDVQFKKDSASNILTKENYILDIHSQDVLYYSNDFFVADSLIMNNIPFPDDMKLKTSNIISYQVGNDNFDEYDILQNNVLKLQTTDSQNWRLCDEKKQIKDVTLQKATTDWGGREWVAWFSSEIPFPVGPYKFHGLPGLIFEIYDTKSNYRFELVKSMKINDIVDNQFIKMTKQKGIPVSWEKYKLTKMKYYESPIDFIRNGVSISKNDEFFLNDGTKVNSANKREVNQHLRSFLKKYNNPIELNKKINYPK